MQSQVRLSYLPKITKLVSARAGLELKYSKARLYFEPLSNSASDYVPQIFTEGEKLEEHVLFKLKVAFCREWNNEFIFPSTFFFFALFLILFRNKYTNFTMVNINDMSKGHFRGLVLLLKEEFPTAHSFPRFLLQTLCRTEAKKRPSHIWSIDFQQRCQCKSMREESPFQLQVLDQLDIQGGEWRLTLNSHHT